MIDDDDTNEDRTLFEGAGLSAAARTSVVSRNPPAGNSNVSGTQDEKQVSVTILILVLDQCHSSVFLGMAQHLIILGTKFKIIN